MGQKHVSKEPAPSFSSAENRCHLTATAATIGQDVRWLLPHDEATPVEGVIMVQRIYKNFS